MSPAIAIRLAVCLSVLAFGAESEAGSDIQIATGNPEGLYFAAGEAICRALAAHPETAGRPCRALPTRGSISNILELDPKTTPFAIVQADAQFNAVSGLGLFEATGPDRNLRSVLSLHSEGFAVLVRDDIAAQTVDDLRGARISAGRTGTGTRETADALFDALNWSQEDRLQLTDLAVSEQSGALCSGKVDAIAFLMGHPAPVISALARSCPVKLVSVPRQAIERLMQEMPYYRPATILPDTYDRNPSAIETVGLRAALVVHADVPTAVVRAVTEAVFRDLETLRTAAPAFGNLTASDMSSSGLIAPLHPGAIDYYRAAGLPLPAVVVQPSNKAPISEFSAPRQDVLSIQPKVTAGESAAPEKVQKPAYNAVPLGPGDKWKLESGDFGGSNPALTGDGDLPSAQDNIRLRIPAPK